MTNVCLGDMEDVKYNLSQNCLQYNIYNSILYQNIIKNLQVLYTETCKNCWDKLKKT